MNGEMTQNDFDATMAVPDPVMEITCSTSTDDTMASVPPDAYGTTVYRTMYFRITGTEYGYTGVRLAGPEAEFPELD